MKLLNAIENAIDYIGTDNANSAKWKIEAKVLINQLRERCKTDSCIFLDVLDWEVKENDKTDI